MFSTSSFCSGGDCVLVDLTGDDVVLVGRTGSVGVQPYTHAEWDAFIAGAKNGEFDRPQTRSQSLVGTQTHPTYP